MSPMVRWRMIFGQRLVASSMPTGAVLTVRARRLILVLGWGGALLVLGWVGALFLAAPRPSEAEFIWTSPSLPTLPSITPGSMTAWDDFWSGTTQSGQFGTLGWRTATNAGTPTTDFTGSAYPHIGVLSLGTSTAVNDDQGLQMDPSGNAQFGNLSAHAGWDATWIVRLPAVTSLKVRVGFEGNTAVSPSDGIWVRFDTDTDTMWTFETRSGASSSTSTTNSITATAGRWVKLRIRSTLAGTILFSICQGADSTAGCTLGSETSLSTNVPSTDLTPGLYVLTHTTAAKVLDVDYFQVSYAGLGR